ncbi:hypothetical protein LPJ61_002153 [Coemansia biformis]|uniref:Survival Motor Neuron Gemin2-binding domain-containing protein n=1 Tax=Coemansia biformis TaxID=1286918 RepID=A0A9W7Y8U6_9FUNG|nr:hypothetical protein LPJ61_002153 [Coemansia biformis]
MAAPRQLVSYDDLFDGEDAAGEPSAHAPQDGPQDNSGLDGDAGDDDAGSDGNYGDSDDMAIVAAHADAWDDSDLIRAWDSHIEGYRREHASMMEDKEYMARQHEQESRTGQWAPVMEEAGAGPSRKRRRGPGEGADSAHAHGSAKLPGTEVSTGDQACQGIDKWAAQLEPPLSKEDALHKLNMAWYYVGYYTACYQYRPGSCPCLWNRDLAAVLNLKHTVDGLHETGKAPERFLRAKPKVARKRPAQPAQPAKRPRTRTTSKKTQPSATE